MENDLKNVMVNAEELLIPLIWKNSFIKFAIFIHRCLCVIAKRFKTAPITVMNLN